MGVPQFSAAEGAALTVLDTLLGLTRNEQLRTYPEWTTVRPELATVATRHIALASVRLLVRDGGYRERALLRDGRRAAGRIWDREVSMGFAPEYSRATYTFWVNAARLLPNFADLLRDTGGVESEGKRKHRRAVRDMVPVEGTKSGDWLFFALVRQNLGQFVLDPDDRAVLEKRLRRASPLVSVLDLEGLDETKGALAARFAGLFEAPQVRILECLDRTLVAAWTSRIEKLYALRTDAEQLALRWRAHANALSAFVSAADAAGRADLLLPVLRLFVALTQGVFREGGSAARTRAATQYGVRSLAARDELVNAIAELLSVATQVQRLRDLLAMERYGDDRYEEAQVFLRMYADEYAPSRSAVEQLYRGLTGAIG